MGFTNKRIQINRLEISSLKHSSSIADRTYFHVPKHNQKKLEFLMVLEKVDSQDGGYED